jgi:hypothetical protein
LNRQSFSPLPPRLGRSSRPSLRIQASLGDKWTPPEEVTQLINEIYQRVQPLANSLVSAIQTALKLQRQWVQQAWARSLLAWAIALGLVTAIANAWGVPALNRKLPQLAQQAAVVLQRDVHIGKVHWIAPTGITGLHPLGSVGPISVGAGPVEGSEATLERVSLGFSPLQSIFRGRLVLTVKIGGAEVHLKQADNFSWFGFPDDTVPSSREFVPGLTEDPKKKNGGNGGGNGGSSGGGSGSAPATTNNVSAASSSRKSRNAARRAAAAAAVATVVPTATPLALQQAPSTSSTIDSAVFASIAQELLKWHTANSNTSLPLASVSVSAPTASSSPSPSPSGDTKSNNASGGWRSLLPFQSSSQKSAEKEEKKVADARKQQLDALNSIEVSKSGGGISRVSTDTPSSSLEAQALPTKSTAAAAGEEKEEVETAAEKAEDRIPLEKTSATAVEPPITTAAEVPPLRHVLEEESLSSGGSGSEEASAGPSELRPVMASARAASVLNSLPSLSIDIRSKSNIAAQEEEELINLQQREPPVESAAVKSINSLGEVAKGQIAPPVQVLQKDPKLAHFKEIVLDQATVRKKGKQA